jgi:hypothetical protein
MYFRRTPQFVVMRHRAGIPSWTCWTPKIRPQLGGKLRPKSEGGVPHTAQFWYGHAIRQCPLNSELRGQAPLTSRRASMLRQSSSIACHSTCTLLDFARSLERFAFLSLNGSDCLSCFHSSASASQYFISEYSISSLASAAWSRHIASNAANCFFEYMAFQSFLNLCPLLIKAN